MQEWVWQHFRLLLPEEWEMLQYSRNSKNGNCAFADRHMFRLEMNWKAFSDWPDFDRMLSDYQARLKNDQSMSDFESVTHGAWQGFHCRDATGWTSRFGRFYEPAKKLLEIVFLWPKEIDRSQAKEILGSVKLELPRDGVQHWRAFGMDVYADEGLVLDECTVQPAMAEMVFVDRSSRPSRMETFERLGMVEEWMRCSVEDWMKVKEPARISDRKKRQKSHAHHSVCIMEARTPAIKFPQFNLKRNRYEAAAWICPDDGRLYRVARIMPAKDERRPGLAGGRLSCCSRMQSS